MNSKIFILSVAGAFLLCLSIKEINSKVSSGTGCGKLASTEKIPWVAGVYLAKDEKNLKLVCLGTVLKRGYIITAAQCIFDPLSNDLRKEDIYISSITKENLEISTDTVQVKPKNIKQPKDYQGFLISPYSDLALLKLENVVASLNHPVCVDWSDLHNTLAQVNSKGILSLGLEQKSIETTYTDYDLCKLITSANFVNILGHDKYCYKASDVSSKFNLIGSGIYAQNDDGKWFLVGVVSATENADKEQYLAATSIRHYLSWLSHVCAAS